MPLDIANGDEHVRQLSTSLGNYNKHLRASIDKEDDALTSDSLTWLCGSTDKLLWFVIARRSLGKRSVSLKSVVAA